MRDGQEPPCGGCAHERPALMDENNEAWYLWRHVQTQMRTSFSGIVGLDYPAMMQVAAILGIDLDAAMLHKIQALEGVLLEEVNAKHGK
jgi:phage related hypothetical protein (DUF1799)|nr:MAG TPA: protein of unknown function DUF1799 [Caudoviricetes sp.]